MSRRIIRKRLLPGFAAISALLLLLSVVMWGASYIPRPRRPSLTLTARGYIYHFGMTEGNAHFAVQPLSTAQPGSRAWQNATVLVNDFPGGMFVHGRAGGGPFWRLMVTWWLLCLLFLVFPLIWVVTLRVSRRRMAGLPCPQCSYDLTGNTSGVCPECGTPVSPVARSVE